MVRGCKNCRHWIDDGGIVGKCSNWESDFCGQNVRYDCCCKCHPELVHVVISSGE